MPGRRSSSTGSNKALHGQGDLDFLKTRLQKLLLNFTWWVNRKDRFGKNVFEGGFLGLDNIGVFDRSAPLPTGGHLEQADGTAWMALFCQNMLEIAVELAAHDPVYEDMAAKFAEHFLWIAAAMNRMGGEMACGTRRMASTTTSFALPDGSATRLKVRSMVGLLPLCADDRRSSRGSESGFPNAVASIAERAGSMPELCEAIHPTGPGTSRCGRTRHHRAGQPGAAAADSDARCSMKNEFLSPYGIRALSRFHAEASLRLSRAGPGVPGGLSAGGIGQRHVRRQLQLARTGLDAGEHAASSAR